MSNRTREDDRWLAEAMGWEFITDSVSSYWEHTGMALAQDIYPPYLTAPTPQSDYECLDWVRACDDEALWDSFYDSFYDMFDMFTFLQDYRPGMIAEALYQTLRETE